MRITEEQRALLSKLKCERLSSDENNLRLVSSFSNPKNDSLAEKLQGEAYEEDENGEVAYYFVGCQYLYLFAADLDPDESLVNYYTHSLDFNNSEDYKTAIPDYDLGCRLLWQDTKDLKERCDYFFDNFNLEK